MIIKAHANYRPYAVAVAQNLLLDDYPNAAAAYSLRKLDKDYTGSAIRVRRTNDNTEQDIGFTASGDLDTASLKTFVGANIATVTTWYDQSGNARNATQTTAANQPRIVDAGTVDRRSGDISLLYDGTDDYLEAASTSGLTISPTSFYAVSSRGNTGNAIRTIFATGILAAERGYGIFYADQTNFSAQDKLYNQVRFQAGSQISARGNYTNTINTNNLLFSTITTTSNNIWYNGGNNASETYSYSNNTTTRNIMIGARRTTSDIQFYLNGSTSEIVIWQSDQSSNRTGIENNINDYYNIYWNGDFAGLLDSFPSSAAAYSLRNLDKDYLGPLVRVRRSNDNAEQDIFGDYYGNLDTVGLKNFVGANSGFVTTWYDQSGNARNATQTTAANQPILVNAGTIDRRNTRPSLFFNAGNTFMQSYRFAAPNIDWSASYVSYVIDATQPNVIGSDEYTSAGPFNVRGSWNATNYTAVSRTGAATSVSTGTISNFTLYASSIKYNSNNTAVFSLNGNSSSTTSMLMGGNPFIEGSTNFVLGRYQTATANALNGNISEFISYRNTSANIDGVRKNQGTYYSIY
jgi:hypothetical protein